jgi:hypothetical protein
MAGRYDVRDHRRPGRMASRGHRRVGRPTPALPSLSIPDIDAELQRLIDCVSAAGEVR